LDRGRQEKKLNEQFSDVPFCSCGQAARSALDFVAHLSLPEAAEVLPFIFGKMGNFYGSMGLLDLTPAISYA